MLSARTIVSGLRTLVYGGIATAFVIRNAETRSALDAALVGGALADYLTWMIRSVILLPAHVWHGCYDCCINLVFGWLLWRFAAPQPEMDGESVATAFLVFLLVLAVKLPCYTMEFAGDQDAD